MTVHRLKTDPLPFQALWLGHKTFEIRWDDRGYEAADLLVLMEWVDDQPTGRAVTAMVGHLMRGGQYGLGEGWVILSLIYPDRVTTLAGVESGPGLLVTPVPYTGRPAE